MRNPGQLFIAGISVLGLSGAPPVVAQDVYKWTDDGGLVNYADIVPPQCHCAAAGSTDFL